MMRLVCKRMFFDKSTVARAVDRTTRRVLSRFGAFVRTTARQSIRRRKKPSPPGKPPSSHTGLLKKFIFFGYERDKKSVVIGPAALNQKNTGAPEVLEYGGTAVIESRWDKHKRRARVAARPFMGPAFAKEKSTLPSLWKDSVRLLVFWSVVFWVSKSVSASPELYMSWCNVPGEVDTSVGVYNPGEKLETTGNQLHEETRKQCPGSAGNQLLCFLRNLRRYWKPRICNLDAADWLSRIARRGEMNASLRTPGARVDLPAQRHLILYDHACREYMPAFADRQDFSITHRPIDHRPMDQASD